MRRCAFLVLFLFACPIAQAAVSEDSSGSVFTPAKQSTAPPSGPGPASLDRVVILAGAELLRMGPANQFLPALAVRYRMDQPWLSAIEIGGSGPIDTVGNFHQETHFDSGQEFDAKIQSAAEAHLAGVWEFCKTRWLVPELTLGLSAGVFKNDAEAGGNAGYPFGENHVTVSQITQLGATVPITRLLALHADLGYVRYSNILLAPEGERFDLFVSALTLRAMVQVRL